MNIDIADRLRKSLGAAVNEYPAQGLLFSGGLDSSVLVYLRPNITAVTISLKSFMGEDHEYFKKLSRFLNFSSNVTRNFFNIKIYRPYLNSD